MSDKTGMPESYRQEVREIFLEVLKENELTNMQRMLKPIGYQVTKIPETPDSGKLPDDVREQIKALNDRLQNGIKYDGEQNCYVLTWTQRELDQAKEEAKEIMRTLGIVDGND